MTGGVSADAATAALMAPLRVSAGRSAREVVGCLARYTDELGCAGGGRRPDSRPRRHGSEPRS